ncbi:hypothetical protein PGT21_018175 [Puccinia graminis f. sp. tritici]|uniref:Uncharacterized protein n=1 Tax=Puccinia graminis f. sp. tritici TaxID=56615 RepID=A0A5B0NW41_PUCGR|nr:hypothetical protein PGT21_018175 [Puccinia graminis f. sp. tritici]KAA1093355.1 hypothetical protein PGTUg99_024950 [Puccinia graminis f. sp. tritici]
MASFATSTSPLIGSMSKDINPVRCSCASADLSLACSSACGNLLPQAESNGLKLLVPVTKDCTKPCNLAPSGPHAGNRSPLRLVRNRRACTASPSNARSAEEIRAQNEQSSGVTVEFFGCFLHQKS